MAESDTVLCEGCDFKSLTIRAHVWCNDCSEGFCEECIKSHEVSKLLRSHHIIPIKDYLTVKRDSVSQVCAVHNKRIERFCRSHDAVLCIKCVQQDHFKCDDLLEIDEAVKGIKESTALSNLEEDIQFMMNNIDKIFKHQNGNRQNLVEQEEHVKQELKNARSKIISHLDDLQTKVLDDLSSKNAKVRLNYDSADKRLEDIKQRIGDFRDEISSLKELGSEKQTFLGVKTITKNIDHEKAAINQEMSGMLKYSLQLNINSNYMAIMRDMKNMGQVKINAETNSISIVDPLSQRAQESSSIMSTPVEMIILKDIIKINGQVRNEEISLCDGVVLLNKQLIFADSANNRLIILKNASTFSHEIKLHSSPEYLCIFKDDSVAVGFETENDLTLVNARTKQKRKLKIKKKFENIHGLAFSENRFYRCVENGEKIVEIDMGGNITRQISTAVKHLWKIAASGSCLYYTDREHGTLWCCNKFGEILWAFQNDLIKAGRYSSSFAFDSNGNIFVLGSGLIVISSGGSSFKVLLNDSELYELNPNYPTGLFYDCITKQLLLTFMYHEKAILIGVGP